MVSPDSAAQLLSFYQLTGTLPLIPVETEPVLFHAMMGRHAPGEIQRYLALYTLLITLFYSERRDLWAPAEACRSVALLLTDTNHQPIHNN